MKHLVLKGQPRDLGREHGETLKKEIHELSQIRNDLIFGFLKDFGKMELEEVAQKHIEYLKTKPALADLYEEFCGISEGSGLGPTDLVILNNYTDLRDFSPPPESTSEDDRREDGCSCLSYRSKKKAFSGQTWDMHASAEPYMTHLTFENPDSDQRIEVLTVTGCLGLSGANTSGLAVYINNMHCRETQVGLIWPALVRGMLQQSTAKEASSFLENHLPSSGHNYMLCDPNESLNIETTGKQFETTQHLPSDGHMLHTNHYLGKLGRFEILSRQSPSTHARMKGLEKFFAEKKEVDLETVCKNLFSEDPDWNVAVPRPRPIHGGMTCGGLMVDHVSGEGRMFRGLYNQNSFSDFNLRN